MLINLLCLQALCNWAGSVPQVVELSSTCVCYFLQQTFIVLLPTWSWSLYPSTVMDANIHGTKRNQTIWLSSLGFGYVVSSAGNQDGQVRTPHLNLAPVILRHYLHLSLIFGYVTILLLLCVCYGIVGNEIYMPSGSRPVPRHYLLILLFKVILLPL